MPERGPYAEGSHQLHKLLCTRVIAGRDLYLVDISRKRALARSLSLQLGYALGTQHKGLPEHSVSHHAQWELPAFAAAPVLATMDSSVCANCLKGAMCRFPVTAAVSADISLVLLAVTSSASSR